MSIFKRIIINEKYCKPLELTPEQIAQAKEIQRKNQEEEKTQAAKLEYEKLPEEEKQKIGLGDFIAKFAQPIAKTIDSVAGTNIQNCGGCKKRQEGLNNLVPDIKNPLNNSKTK